MTNKEFIQHYSKLALQLNQEPTAIKSLVLGVGKMSMQELILAYDQPVQQLEKVEQMAHRYLYELYPIQYMLNEAHFYGLSFYVDERVLIPRYDTEILVENILKNIDPDQTYRLIEIGTGSGCIAVALKKFAPNIEIIAVDFSGEALEVAKINAQRHKVELSFAQSDVFNNVNQTGFDLVVSNPPYLSHDDEVAEDVKRYEPLIALYSEMDGMKHYQEIIEQAKPHLKKGYVFALEVAWNKATAVAQLFEKLNMNVEIEIIQDLNQKDRVLIAKDRN